MTDLQRALIAKRYGDTPHEVITVFPDGGELHRFKNRAGDDYLATSHQNYPTSDDQPSG